ncbi:DUF2383 domain-containing protein [Aestuariivivens marinum]|uniref:DUF2383 domain-containing protein n=1 Tax=Aestuariivivens marinum TaxID=2913555 RepID=UPI001F5699E4|nr:DUF2383 domain-containing protein [Aestuariivivens marinum]
MKVKQSEKVIIKINNLLEMNFEIEKIYLDSVEIVNDKRLKTFFRERAFERNEFGRGLRKQIIKLGGEPKNFDKLNRLSSRYYILWKNIRPMLNDNRETELLDQICSIKQWSIDNYNSLLQEINLSLSLCKLLVGQRDALHVNMNAIKAKEALVA